MTSNAEIACNPYQHGATAKGDGATASISLSLLLRDAHDIASSSLRELDAVALATNVMLFLGRDTSPKDP